MSAATTVTPQGPASPTRAVLAAIENGVATVQEIGARTGLDPQLVDTAIARLIAAGYLDSQALRLGCPPSGCRSCPSAEPTGCGVNPGGGRATSDGPVMVTLTARPRPQ